jgi:acetolactate synthase-1/2/3 large subunit
MDLDMTNRNSRSGGRILVDQLLVHGADMAFCVPGESYLEVLDALYDSPAIRLVNARHEAGAANMAEAYGKLTGRPGIAMVTRGPGACHAAVGVHTAFQDSTPMILIVGQVAREAMDREGFQEIDYRQMFGPVAKWTAQIDRTDRIPEYMSRAYHVATSGRPGPVVLALPEDMLVETADVRDAQPYVQHRAAATAGDIAAVRGILAGASRPLMLIGGSCWSDEACRQAIAFAEANGIPTAVSFRRQDLFSTRSPVYAGDIGTSGPPALIARFKEADVVLVVGARLGEMTTQGYTTLDSPEPRQALIHVHPHADELGRVFRPTLGIVSSGDGFFAATSAMAPLDPTRWAEWTAAARLPRHAGGAGLCGTLRCRARHARARRVAARRRDRHTGCRKPHGLAPALSRVRAAAPRGRADIRGDGIFGTGRGRREPRAPRSGRRRLRWRWRFHDVGAGGRDGGPVRQRADHRRLQQPHVWHHPHAPGA